MNSKPLDLVVVGAGIVGLATAHRYLTEHPGKSVVVVERESGPAYHQTGRNSGVLHSYFETILIDRIALGLYDLIGCLKPYR